MPDRSPGSTLIGLVVVSLLAWPRASAQAETSPFSTCNANFTADHQSARCYFEVAKQEALWDDAAQLLRDHLDQYPKNPWLHLYLGHVLLYKRLPKEAEELYRLAVSLARGSGDVEAEVIARLRLTQFLGIDGNLEEGDEVLAEAVRLAEEKGDLHLLAEVRIRQAWQYRAQGMNLDHVYRLLDQVQTVIFPDGREDLKRDWLKAMTAVSQVLGRNDEAESCLERRLAESQAAGDLIAEAEDRYGIAVHHITVELPSPLARQEARRLFEAALSAAQSAGHPFIEARVHHLLGSRVASGVAEQDRRHLEACIDIASHLGNSGLLSGCQGALAAALVDEKPQEAIRLMDRALAEVRDSNDLWAMAYYGSLDRLLVRWATLVPADAIADSLEVLDALESLRELQRSGSGRAGLMTLLSEIYYWLSGQLLESNEEHGDLELAFSLTERMRSRVLLEALEAARAAAPPPAANSLVRQLDEVLKRKVELNRQLLSQEGREARDQALAELDRVESEESGLRDRIAQAFPSFGFLTAPALADLSAVEHSLDEDEAMLSFQIGLDEDYAAGRFQGGAWLLASTRAGTRVYRRPDRVVLDPAVDMVMGLADLDRASASLAYLYRDLLGKALDELPDGVKRLVIIPDGKLHRLPFALLSSDAESEPLIARYQVSLAPSATLWLRWRRLGAPTAEVAALALADPLLVSSQAAPAATAAGAGERQWAFEQGAKLGPLPYARQEGRAVVRALGGGSRLLVGEEAAESFLKENDLRRYGVLHFAAHAVINDEVPERSAILLAPGAEDEDGWLQPQDIVGLDLEGCVVVLASCESAAGRVLRGEGPMSLARSFFYAGAPVVVASLWPLPDDQTARLFKQFYKRLADGASVAGALADAQRTMLARGAPARAWAGLVALGNGDLVPFPGGLGRPGPPVWVYVALVILALAALFLVTRARGGGRRTRSSSRRGGAEPSR